MSKNILGTFDREDIEIITRLIDKLQESSFDYLKLESDGVKIVIGKKGMTEGTEENAPVAQSQAKVQVAPQIKHPTVSSDEKTNKSHDSSVSPEESVSEQTGIVVIKSPSYGLFYTQQGPGSPPYVNLGDVVKAGETVGLLEIMKTFTAITSEVDGEVVQIHVKNEQVLEPGQPLFSIKLK
jgi:acetyl-CoA carboxylase biotin carboxyl carrier protein